MHPAKLRKTYPSLDDLDEGILRALHANGRASWAQIAQELGSSTSTVRRRFELLHRKGRIRVIGRVDVTRVGLGIPVMVQFSGRDASRSDFLRTLQAHSDVRYTSAVAGSAGCVAEIVTQSLQALQSVIHEITLKFDVEAESFVITHTYTSGQDWLPDSVDRAINFEIQRLPAELSHEERVVLGLLLADGRTSLGALAAPIGKSESTARRILETLVKEDIVSFRVLAEPELLGFQSEFWVWIYVEPEHLAAVGSTLAANPATKTLFATAGRSNLAGQFVLQYHTDIYAFMTDVLGALKGVRGMETMLQTTTYKRVWNKIDNGTYSGVAGPQWLFGTAQAAVEDASGDRAEHRA